MRSKKSSFVRVSRRYSAGATRRSRLRVSRNVRRRAAVTVVVCLAVVAVALIWGSALKRRSDAYHAGLEADAWTASTQAALRQITVPDFRGGAISPGGELPRLPADASGAVVTLSENPDGHLGYAFPTAATAGLTVAEGAPTPEAEVGRLHRAGLRVLGIFRVQCLDDVYRADPAAAVLRRGVELSLLTSAARAGIDELLLLGIPCGNDDADARALDFLRELKQLLADSGTALGVALPADAFVRAEGETVPDAFAQDSTGAGIVQYTGWRTPGRMLSVCDYLALDLRTADSDSAGELLRGFRFTYARYALRLLVADAAVSETADAHGMRRQIVCPATD